MNRAAVASMAIAILAFAVFLTRMTYPWQLAVLAGTAIGALAYSGLTTWTRMRRLYRPPDAGDLSISRTSDVGEATPMEGYSGGETSYTGGGETSGAGEDRPES